MGAEGSIVVMPRWQWNQHTDADPKEMGFYIGTMLGTDAVWTYFGEPEYETAVSWYALDAAAKELVEWFEANAETHEVWT